MDSVSRFSNRAKIYAKYRPRYPDAVIACLADTCGLSPSATVADVGAGTGILTELFLRNGNPVYAVEPNAAMRGVAEAQLQGTPGFHSIDGRAEATTLPKNSVDFVVAGQAFHWFEPVATRREFRRILKPGGWIALIWNDRRLDSTPFMRAYHELLDEFGRDYRRVDQKYTVDDAAFRAFFGSTGFAEFRFANPQQVDLEGLVGRLTSTSYMPIEGDPAYDAMMKRAFAVYEANAQHDHVVIEYDTVVYVGAPD